MIHKHRYMSIPHYSFDIKNTLVFCTVCMEYVEFMNTVKKPDNSYVCKECSRETNINKILNNGG